MKTDIDLEQFPKEILTDHKIFHFEPQKFRAWIEKGQNEYLVVSKHQILILRTGLLRKEMATTKSKPKEKESCFLLLSSPTAKRLMV